MHSFTVEQPLADLPENEGTMNDGNIEVGDGDWPSHLRLPRHLHYRATVPAHSDVVNASTISARTFLMRYLAPSQPVLEGRGQRVAAPVRVLSYGTARIS